MKMVCFFYVIICTPISFGKKKFCFIILYNRRSYEEERDNKEKLIAFLDALNLTIYSLGVKKLQKMVDACKKKKIILHLDRS
jgi:hypothetical protein